MRSVVGSFAMVSLLLVVLPAAGAERQLADLDVCALVPGEEVAEVLGMRLVSTRTSNSPDGKLARCVYLVSGSGPSDEATGAYVVALLPPTRYAELRPFQEEPTRDVPGIGDGAWIVLHSESARYDLYALRTGDVTVEVTGEDDSAVRKVAGLAVPKLAATAAR